VNRTGASDTLPAPVQPVAPPHVIVIFGGNGDLAKRRLLPALYHLFLEGLLPKDWRVIGNSRRPVTDEEFRDLAHDAIREFSPCKLEDDTWQEFQSRLRYASGEFAPGDTQVILEAVERSERELGDKPRRLYYLSVPPGAFVSITEALGESGLRERARVVYEKPFGLDKTSFHELNDVAHRVLDEEQIYTIDHFLAKETLQNVLALRFANGMFEPVWNRSHIDHIQIDVPEELGVGTRGTFFDRTGALRDMVVTHLFQVLAVIAMEPPYALDAKPLLDEKIKIFESMVPLRAEEMVRGQYEGYRDTAGVDPDSDTETFVAARVNVDNWRWAGVPFYLRTGKRLAASRQVVTLAFRRPPRRMFRAVVDESLPSDRLTLEMSGQEGMSISFLAKRPGPSIDLAPASLRFVYDTSVRSELIGAYERLLHDALLGDRSLFTRADGIERTWELVDDVLADPPPSQLYRRGSWGPRAADELIAPRRWQLPEPAYLA
jgi:glucose-6-phosphate 1-dehydrogenase